MFTDDTLRFLRALKRHNDRDWFKARRDQYDLVVKQPMVAIVERLAVDLRSFAPELVASPRISLYRVYRDTRFTGDKSPLKTHVGAVIPRRGLPRHESAGFYFEVAPEHTLVAGGVYAPQPAQLRAIRVHIAANEARWRKLVEHRAFRQTYGGLQGDKLTRVPAGFCRDDPAAEYLKLRQYIAWQEYPPEYATSPRFYRDLLAHFRRLAPFVRFLNEPLVALSPGPKAPGAVRDPS